MNLAEGIQVQKPSGTVCAPVCQKSWYALYTCAQHEKRVASELESREVTNFLPVYRSLRRWKDRRVELDLPLFPGYLFVHLELNDRLRVLQVPGVVRIVGFNGQPQPVAEYEITALRNTVGALMRIEPFPYLTTGCRVRIRQGPLAGIEGILLRKKKQCRLVLSLNLIASSVAVEIDGSDVERVA